MAGYSGTPLVQKLGIKEDHAVALLHAPDGFALDLPEGVTLSSQLRGGEKNVVVFFTTECDHLVKQFTRLKTHLLPSGGLWICWPKKASKVATDLTEDVIRAIALANGLVDNKVCAVDDTWSGLRLVYRLKDRRP